MRAIMKYRLPANWRSMAVFAFDLLAVVLAWVGGFLLRMDFQVSAD